MFEFLDKLFVLLLLAFDELSQVALLVWIQFKVKGLDSTDQLYFCLDLISDLFLPLTEHLDHIDDFVQNNPTQGLDLAFNKIALVFLAN